MNRNIRSPCQEKWDQRYRTQPSLPAAAEVLTRNQQLLPSQGKGLDIACGLGANSLFLARRGLQMEAVDISPVALAALEQRAVEYGLPISTRRADLESGFELKAGHYDLIVVSRYLHRPLCQKLVKSLAKDGMLFYQTFAIDQNAAQGRAPTRLKGPRTLSYKLQANELLHLFASLETIYHFEDSDSSGVGAKMAYYVGRKR